jgi:hypothetical protein
MQIKKMHKIEFKKLCKEHGKKLNDCMGCVAKIEGVLWSVDTNHKSYPGFVEITTIPPAIEDVIDDTTTTEGPNTSFTYSFYNRKYTKE